ncbi:hypothetical protein MD484_g7783, partial [Candolleomyces efflorescens]
MPNTTSSTSPGSGLHRRLSARRGSITALDPYAVHADINENPNRTSSSKLTIVRVLSPQPQQPSTPITLNEAPASFTSSSRRRRHGSSGAAGSGGGGGSAAQADSPPPGRLSFAFSSFGAADSGHQVGGGEHQRTGSGGAPSSPSSSPRMRPSSPRLSANPYQHHHHHHHHHHGGIGLKPRLTPDQLVDLARQASSPRTLAQIANSSPSAGSAGPSSPAPSSAGPASASPVLRSQPLSASLSGGGVVSTNVAPATFTPLPDDIFLPFVDRPSEVAQLISIPPDAKLFALLAQTLPKTYEPPAGTGTVTVVDPVTGEEEVLEELPNDPSLWTYDHLIYHLTQVDRDVAPDPIWAFAARKCILSHSELLWERVKGGLGVPPELDIDYDFTRAHQRSHSEEKLDAKMRKLRQELRDGAPKNRLGQSASHNESALDDEESEEEEDVEDKAVGGKWTAATNVRGVDKSSTATPVASGRSDSVHEVGGVVIGSFNNPSSSIGIAMEGPSPPLGATNEGLNDDDVDEDFISIEPLIAPSPESVGALGSHPPPLSLGSSTLLEEGLASDTPAGEGMGLGDIAEGEEEEEEEGEKQAGDNTGVKQATAEETKEELEEELIPPSQIQGLRILTSPVHAAGAYGVGGLFVPHHQLPSNLLHPTNLDGSAASMMASPLPVGDDGAAAPGTGTTLAQALASGAHETTQANTTQPHVISPPAGGYRSHSRTSSFSSITGISIGPFSRSESTGNLAALIAAQQQHYAGSDAGDSAGYGSDWSVGATGGGSNASGSVTGVQSSAEVVGDRLPGQPLFVSNFARLNGCPTLKGG